MTGAATDARNRERDASGPGPLAGVRVVELGMLLAGPFTGRLLGDMGAEIIKVEPPGQPDPLREWGHARYEGRYLLGTSIARIPTARGQMRYAKRIGGNVLVHGSTGKGNDQVRFETVYRVLQEDPAFSLQNFGIFAPWKEAEFLARFGGHRVDAAECAQPPDGLAVRLGAGLAGGPRAGRPGRAPHPARARTSRRPAARPARGARGCRLPRRPDRDAQGEGPRRAGGRARSHAPAGAGGSPRRGAAEDSQGEVGGTGDADARDPGALPAARRGDDPAARSGADPDRPRAVPGPAGPRPRAGAGRAGPRPWIVSRVGRPQSVSRSAT